MNIKTVAVSLLTIAAGTFVGLSVLLYFVQERLIFFRQPLDVQRRDSVLQRFPHVEEVNLVGEDGARLHGFLSRPQAAAGATFPLIIYFGGNGEEVSWLLEERERPLAWGWLMVNYRGYGWSEGSPDERKLVADARRLYDWAQSRPDVQRTRIVAFGRSLGSGVAVRLATERSLAGLILATPFDSLESVAKRHYPFAPVSLLLRHRFDSLALAPRIGIPMLCIVAERDSIIPAEHARRLFAAWQGEKQLVAVANAGHNDVSASPEFWREIGNFLSRISPAQ
ncbi:MAG TPA: dienelactone hydrolase family protein [Burkholderiales bacterium]|nr:dienelactone hydrolase family protein [Burkholderiales bacterium]